MSDFIDQEGYKTNSPANDQNPNKKQEDILTVAKGGSVALAGSITERVIHYIYSTALIWGLGAESFGLFTLALAITTFIGVLSNLGLPYGIVRFGATGAHEKNLTGIHQATMNALRIALLTGILFTLILLWGTNLISQTLFNKPELAPIIKALALSIPFLAIQSSLLAGTRAVKIVKYSVIVWVVQPLMALLLAIPMLMRGSSISLVSLAYVFSYILGASLSIYFYRRAIPREFRTKENFPLGQMIRFSIPLSITQWIHYVNERTEIFFLGLLPGAVDVGIYNIAWRVAGLETVFHLSMDHILAPISSNLSHRQDIEKLDAIYKTTTKWAFTGALLLFLIFSFSSVTIMNIFDPSYITGSSVLIILGFAQLVNAATGSCNTILIMSGHSDLSLLNTVVLFAASIALDWLLIPRYALGGAAIAGAAAVILVNIMRVMEVWFTLKIHPFKGSFIKPVFAGILGLITVQALRTYIYSGGLLVDMSYSLLLAVIYVILLYVLKLDDDDMFVMKAIGSKIQHRLNLKGAI